jgi:secondary thiamine-phosphate synthase enzyme
MRSIITISTNKHQELVDITREVIQIVRQVGVKEGICTVYVPHATAAVILNESADPNIKIDFLNAINRAIPEHAGYLHDRIDSNAAAHIKAAIIGPSESIPIKD